MSARSALAAWRKPGLFLERRLAAAFGWLLGRWVRVRAHPEDFAATLDRSLPTVYVLQVAQLSSLLVLQREAARTGLPDPLAPLVTESLHERRAQFHLGRSGRPPPLLRPPARPPARLRRLIAASLADPQLQVQLVPVHVFWGRAPDKQDSVLKALFADSWVAPGALVQLVRILVHGRDTMLRLGAPMPLRALLGDAREPEAAAQRAMRALRAEFARERELAIGPNLSHRQTLINGVIASPAVQAAIRARIETGTTAERAERQARRNAYEIASDYSYPVVRAFDILLTALWERTFDGVQVYGFERLRAIAPGRSLVYLPCHRSHVDYLLLSWLLYHRGLQPPHVAAGVNLRIALVGPLLRRGGAFFMRRSFKGDPLYAAVFAEYLHTMLASGFPIEFFVEGGRSRTGRMLEPRTGLLGMTVESHLRGSARPLAVVPVYIGYEKVIEGPSYLAELAGSPKRKETLGGVLRAVRRLRERLGRAHVCFGEPIDLDAFLAGLPSEEQPTGGRMASAPAVARLADAVARGINDAVVVNAINLVAVAMLAAPRRALDAGRLAERCDALRAVLERIDYAVPTQVLPIEGRSAIEHGERLGILRRVEHPMGDIVEVAPGLAPLLGYFRNNVLHLLCLPALVACIVGQAGVIGRARLRAGVARIFPFLRAELYVSLDAAAALERMGAVIETFETLGLVREESGAIIAAPRNAAEYETLDALAQSLQPSLERFFMVVAVLDRFGSGTLSPEMLEDLCLLLAQRHAALYVGSGAEFTDRAALRRIVSTLQGEPLALVREEGGMLVFGEALGRLAAEAPLVLAEQALLAVAKTTQLSAADVERVRKELERH